MVPFFGNNRQKKMMIVEMASPESRPAEVTSGERTSVSDLQVVMGIQGRTVVLRPPGEVPAADDVVEDEADDTPRDVVRRRCGRNETGASEDNGPVDVTDEGAREALLDEVRQDRDGSANEEEPHELVVQLAGRENARWADDAPDDGRGAEDGRVRAAEAVLLVRAADVVDVAEHPGLHTELDGTGDCGSDDLTPEHRSWSGRNH